MVTLLHQCGPQAQENDEEARKTQCLDTYSLIDALVEVLGCEEREWASFAMVNVATILKISIMVLGSPDKISKLPLLDYLSEKVVTMCYERAWYHKMGGCECIRLLFTHTPSSFLLPRITTYLRALIFSIIDLSGEVCVYFMGFLNNYIKHIKKINNYQNQRNLHGNTPQTLKLTCNNPAYLLLKFYTNITPRHILQHFIITSTIPHQTRYHMEHWA